MGAVCRVGYYDIPAPAGFSACVAPGNMARLSNIDYGPDRFMLCRPPCRLPSLVSASTDIKSIAVDLIQPGAYQARKRFAPEALAELARSISESGLVQPVVLRSTANGYELLAGERRWRAAQLAGVHEIPALVRDDLDDREAYVLGLIENLQRESLSPIETAKGLGMLAATFELTHEAVAGRIGKSRAYVSNFLRLLNLDARVQDWVDAGQLSLGHAKVLAGVEDARQIPLAAETIQKGWSVRALERRCSGAARKKRARPTRKGDLAGLEKALGETLGNVVNIDYDEKRRRGELRIRFHGLDEFDGLLHRLGYKDDL